MADYSIGQSGIIRQNAATGTEETFLTLEGSHQPCFTPKVYMGVAS